MSAYVARTYQVNRRDESEQVTFDTPQEGWAHLVQIRRDQEKEASPVGVVLDGYSGFVRALEALALGSAGPNGSLYAPTPGWNDADGDDLGIYYHLSRADPGRRP